MRKTALSSSIAVAILAAVSSQTVAQAPPITVIAREGRRPIAVTSINNQEYLALDDVNGIFHTTSREDRLAGGLTISAGARAVVLTADQNVVSVSGRLVSLPSPVLRRDNRWLVPVDFLPRALALALDTRLDYRRATRLLVAGDLRVPRAVARVETAPSRVVVTFDVTPNTEARITPQPGRLVLQFKADAVDLLTPTLPQQPLLSTITLGDNGSSVLLSTGGQFSTYRMTTSQPDAGSGRVTVELASPTTDAAPTPPTAPTAPPPAVLLPPATPGLRTVVLDPGHGGEELGTQGAKGTFEKDITLAVAKRLRTMIESRLGLKVYLTREDDRTLSLDDRAAFANSRRADVFLSIHANSAVRPGLRGAEVYYLTVERADEEARKRADDNAASLPALGGGSRTIDLILWETAQARHLQHSATLAGLVEQALKARVEMSPRAVQQAPFRVLVGANMPAALVEIGYLSNGDQETQLATAEYQDLVAQALMDALVKFREFLEP